MTTDGESTQNEAADPSADAVPRGVDSAGRTAVNMVWVTAASVVQLVLQFVFFQQLAAIFAFREQADALAAALVVPSVLVAMLTGSLGYVLVPELVAQFATEGGSRRGWQLAWFTGGITALLAGLVSLAIFLAAPLVCKWLFDDLSSAGRQETIRLMRILCIQVLLTSGISWAQAVHHARHRFIVPALGGVLGVAVGLGIVLWRGHADIAVFAWAINAGSAISLAVHLYPLLGHYHRPRADVGSLLRLAAGLWPLLTGAALIRVDPIVDRVLADELEGSGAIAAIHYSQRIMAALLAIGTSSLSLIVFPQLSQHWAEGGRAGLARHFSVALRRLVLLVVPIAVGFSCFAEPIVRDLLQRGEFTADDARLVAWLVVALMGMFVGASAGELLARGFYVLGDTRTPTWVGLGAMLLGVGLKFALFPWLGLWAIPLGTSFYFLLSTATMGVLLARRIGWDVIGGCKAALLWATTSSGVACGCSFLIYATRLGGTLVAAPLGAVVYVACLWGCGVEDVRQLFRELKSKYYSGA